MSVMKINETHFEEFFVRLFIINLGSENLTW